MIVLDAETLAAIAAIIGSISSLVWSIRRDADGGARGGDSSIQGAAAPERHTPIGR